MTLDRRNLTPDEQTAVAQLTAAGKDLDGTPAPIPGSEFCAKPTAARSPQNTSTAR